LRATSLTVLVLTLAALSSAGCRRESSGTQPAPPVDPESPDKSSSGKPSPSGKNDGTVPKGTDVAKALSKESLLGEWEGSLPDGTGVALLFTDKFVVVSILAPGSNRQQARKDAKWASGNSIRSLNAGGTRIWSTAYQIDAEKNEVMFGYPKPTATGKLAKDGALLVFGEFETRNFSAKVPEARLSHAKE
jgi:hypothetical protein